MKFAIVLVSLAVVTGCASPKLVPKPNKRMAAKSGVELQELKRGHQIFTTTCIRCHEQRVPSKISDDRWHEVMPAMAWNAGLSKADQEAVEKYVMAARQ